MQSKLKSS